MYTTFEEEKKQTLLSGRSLTILEFDKIRTMLSSHARSVYGRELCEELLPCSDLNEVEIRQKDTDSSVTYILREGQLPLSGLSDIRESLSLVGAQGTLSMKSLLAVACFIRAVDRIISVYPKNKDTDEGNGLFSRILMLIPASSLEKEISFCIASEDEMNDRASDALYQIRRHIKDSQTSVRDILERIIRQHPTALQEQLVTLRGERYVVPVKSEKRSEIPGIIHDTSSSGQTIFVEPMAVVEANNKIREWLAEEREEIERILMHLSGRVAAFRTELLTDTGLAGEIDFLSAKANLSISMNASQPIFNREGRILLRKARHPLIPKDKVVPIDFAIGDTYRTLVITGPNTGGKTVSLKTCGLLCLMAMAGLQIPCQDHSEVSVFDRILADIGDEQSIEQSLSTFSSHMKNLVSIIENTGHSTLVLADELGSGTDPSEGAALAIAILDHLRKAGAVTVATTHYKELKGYAIETEGVENACCEFDTETLSPTYRLLIGLPGVSNAFHISRKLGLSQDIIDAAQMLLSDEGIRFEELLSSVEKNNLESEKLKKEIRRMRENVKEQAIALQKERDDLEQKKSLILQKAQEEKKELLADALEEADLILKDLRRSIREDSQQAAEEKVQLIRRNLRAGLTDLDTEAEKNRARIPIPGEMPGEIRLGGLYFSPSLGASGTIVKGPDSRGNFVLQSGSLRVNVTRDSLRYPIEGQEAQKARDLPGKSRSRSVPQALKKGGASDIRMQRASTTMPEIQLLGMTVDEAISALDRYLDDCVLSNISTVRIVHGKGTGALRSAVSQHLRQDKRVMSFRLGTYGEGEDGVTIAQL